MQYRFGCFCFWNPMSLKPNTKGIRPLTVGSSTHVARSRYRHSAVVHGCAMFVFGGVDKRQAVLASAQEFWEVMFLRKKLQGWTCYIDLWFIQYLYIYICIETIYSLEMYIFVDIFTDGTPKCKLASLWFQHHLHLSKRQSWMVFGNFQSWTLTGFEWCPFLST